MIKKNMILAGLLILRFELCGMESAPCKPLELANLAVEVKLEIIKQGIESFPSVNDAMQFIRNIASTNREFNALVNDSYVVSALFKKCIEGSTSLQDAWKKIHQATMTNAKFSSLLVNNQKVVQNAFVEKINELNLNPQQELYDFMQIDEKIGNVLTAIVIHALLAAGAQINKQDEDSFTALMYAANRGNLDAVKTLIALGADLTLKDSTGWTALRQARDNAHSDVEDVLVKAGGINEEV